MLSGKGFNKLYNLSGGINGWESEIAMGPQDSGLHLFDGAQSIEETLTIGFGLEQGLREFYLSMISQVTSDEAKKLFTMLADIEILHQNQIVDLHNKISGESSGHGDFLAKVIEPAMEGGISTDDYINLYSPDLNRELDILSLAMSIEAQALDLYSRAADKEENIEIKGALQQIADEERSHIERLAEYIEKLS